MTTAATLIIAALIVAGLGLLLAPMIRRRPAPKSTGALALERVAIEGEQWAVQTDAGPAVITRVFHPDKGDCYEIEHEFGGRGHTVLLYVAPSLKIVEATLRRTVAQYLNGTAT